MKFNNSSGAGGVTLSVEWDGSGVTFIEYCSKPPFGLLKLLTGSAPLNFSAGSLLNTKTPSVRLPLIRALKHHLDGLLAADTARL